MSLRTQFPAIPLFLTLLVLAAWPGFANAESADPKQPTNSASGCLMCHNNSHVTSILKTPHGQASDKRTPFAGQACESCHGSGSDHMRAPTTVLPPFVFGPRSTTPVEKQNEVCLECHNGGGQISWIGSSHEAADVPCTACHTAHAVEDPTLSRKSEAGTCYTCHAEQRADAHKRSRHPITEAKTICSDCHNSHGAHGPDLLKEASVNDTCFSCHAEKRGPFLWEHAPVRDDCSICHTSHGSNHASLMKARTPWLCQECHQENFHPSSLYSGTGLPTASPNVNRKSVV